MRGRVHPSGFCLRYPQEMHALLCGDLCAEEHSRWRDALQAAAPGWQWLDLDAARRQPDAVQVAVVANPPPGSLQGLPRLQLIQSLWAGVDRLLADPTLPPAVPLARMVDPAMSAAMAETALWAVLALQRGFFGYARQQRQARWQVLPQRRADETRVTLLGLGAMGQACAMALQRQGFALKAWTRAPRAPQHVPDGVQALAGDATLPELLAASDIVVNLLPLTPDTRGLIDARFLAALPHGAGLVNLARGAHVVEADLLAALDSGQLGHAVLDVFSTEPLPGAHPFWAHPAVTVLPHAAALTDPRSAAAVVAANLQALLDGRPIAHQVDRQRGY
jgi:glyoxylate/hydroxypyruvate reductase A